MPVNTPTKGQVTAQGVFAEIEAVKPRLNKREAEFQPRLTSFFDEFLGQIIPSLKRQLTKEQINVISNSLAITASRDTLDNLGKVQSVDEFPEVIADSLTSSITANSTLNPINNQEGTKQLNTEEVFKKVSIGAEEISESSAIDLEKLAVLKKIEYDLSLQEYDPASEEIVEEEIEEYVEKSGSKEPENDKEDLLGSVGRYKQIYAGNYNEAIAQKLANTQVPTLEELQEVKDNAHNLSIATLVQNTNRDDISKPIENVGIALGLASPTQENLEENGLGYSQPNPLTFARMANANDRDAQVIGADIASKQIVKENALGYLLVSDPRYKHNKQEIVSSIERLSQQNRLIEARKQEKLLKILQKAESSVNRNPKQKQVFSRIFNRQDSRTAWKVFSTYSSRGPRFVPSNLISYEIISQGVMGPIAYQGGSGRFNLGRVPIKNTLKRVAGFKGFGKARSGLTTARGSAALVKGATSVAKGATVVGAVAMAAQSKTLRKIAAGAVAYGLYLLAMLGLKGIGLLVGLGFGAVTGLPLLFLGPPGWIAYAGWVAYWGYHGWTNPMSMINIVTHPLESLTNLINSAKSFFGDIGGSFGGVGSGISSAFGSHPIAAGVTSGAATGATIGFVFGGPIGAAIGATIGAGIGYLASGGAVQIKNFVAAATGTSTSVIGGFFASAGSAITGFASTIWGSFVGAGGSFLSGAFSIGGSLWGSLTSLSVPSSLVTIPVAGAFGSITIGSILVGVTTSAALFDPELKDALTPGITQNNLFVLEKIASPSEIRNDSDLPTTITFTITLTALEELNNISISDQLRINGETPITPPSQDNEGRVISQPCGGYTEVTLVADSPWTCVFTVTAEPSWMDSTVINTVNVTATSTTTSETIADSAVATTTIGDPPECAPDGIPIPGPWKLTSDFDSSHPLGVDINNESLSGPVISTFPCTTTVIYADWLDPRGSDGYGYTVILQSGIYKTISGHLIYPDVNVGDRVPPYGEIGPMGTTGYSTGVHVHYEVHVNDALVNPHDYGIPNVPLDQIQSP